MPVDAAVKAVDVVPVAVAVKAAGEVKAADAAGEAAVAVKAAAVAVKAVDVAEKVVAEKAADAKPSTSHTASTFSDGRCSAVAESRSHGSAGIVHQSVSV